MSRIEDTLSIPHPPSLILHTPNSSSSTQKEHTYSINCLPPKNTHMDTHPSDPQKYSTWVWSHRQQHTRLCALLFSLPLTCPHNNASYYGIHSMIFGTWTKRGKEWVVLPSFHLSPFFRALSCSSCLPLSMTHLYRMDKQALQTVVSINCRPNNNTTTTKRYILVLVFLCLLPIVTWFERGDFCGYAGELKWNKTLLHLHPA